MRLPGFTAEVCLDPTVSVCRGSPSFGEGRLPLGKLIPAQDGTLPPTPYPSTPEDWFWAWRFLERFGFRPGPVTVPAAAPELPPLPPHPPPFVPPAAPSPPPAAGGVGVGAGIAVALWLVTIGLWIRAIREIWFRPPPSLGPSGPPCRSTGEDRITQVEDYSTWWGCETSLAEAISNARRKCASLSRVCIGPCPPGTICTPTYAQDTWDQSFTIDGCRTVLTYSCPCACIPAPVAAPPPPAPATCIKVGNCPSPPPGDVCIQRLCARPRLEVLRYPLRSGQRKLKTRTPPPHGGAAGDCREEPAVWPFSLTMGHPIMTRETWQEVIK